MKVRMTKVLVVENDHKTVGQYPELLQRHGYEVESVQDNRDAISCLDRDEFELVITDASVDGKRMLETVVDYYQNIPCIVVSSKASVRDSVALIKRGAVDFVIKTDSTKDLIESMERAINDKNYKGPHRRKSDKSQTPKFGELVGESPAIHLVFRAIEKVAVTDSTVLITGESGTGKELIARAVHYTSDRQDKPLVVINCGAIPGELLESELFGHEKGAFTGAHRIRIGRFEMADKGTIFLDEIGDMSPDLQVKLLRVLQEQSFERVGSTKPLKVNVRIIAATNKKLRNSIKEGTFREDLFYRLNVIPIQVPPLRERKTDIPLLKDFFLSRLGGRRRHDRKRMKFFSDKAMEFMVGYDWPGNIRELENTIERLSVLVEDDIIDVADLPEKIRGGASSGDSKPVHVPYPDGTGFNEAVEQYQKDLILHALNQTNWVKAKAADLLKMNRTTLVEKIKKMRLEPPVGRPSNNGMSETISG
jgi:DNA-binding NtrC family response regulator